MAAVASTPPAFGDLALSPPVDGNPAQPTVPKADGSTVSHEQFRKNNKCGNLQGPVSRHALVVDLEMKETRLDREASLEGPLNVESKVPQQLKCQPGLRLPTPATRGQGELQAVSEDAAAALQEVAPSGTLPVEATTIHTAPAPSPEEDTSIKLSQAEEDLAAYSLKGITPLDSFIPEELLPDELFVHDPHNVTAQRDPQGSSHGVVRYVRVRPKYALRPDPDAPPRVAHLYLSPEHSLGKGSHSSVYCAPLRLRLDPSSEEESRVRVAVKAAFGHCFAHYMLHKEAKLYDLFPRDFMEETEVALPDNDMDDGEDEDMSVSETHSSDGEAEDVEMRDTEVVDVAGHSTSAEEEPEIMTLPPVVPKFFGFYKPANDRQAETEGRKHGPCFANGGCDVSWPTWLLLVEECGDALPGPALTEENKWEIAHLFERMHDAGFIHGSPYPRNVLIQPGPVSVRRAERSMNTPSFRVIDFGRTFWIRDGLRQQKADEWRVLKWAWSLD
ncbi:hypothetical protein BD413DRAFT_617090 [Trametes elegans]|nr:hypothetical protein BD413DRAFT_617090 [Trametes elegans]